MTRSLLGLAAALGAAGCLLEFDRSRIAGCPDCVTSCEDIGDGTRCASGSATGLCYAENCCVGCWDGAACLAGNEPVSCGAHGDACATCESGDQCVEGVCRVERAVVALSLGGEASCAVDALGDAWCWGRSASGQLGIEGAMEIATPTKLAIGAGAWADIGVGGVLGHACGLQKDGSIWCWGSNGDGQLGIPGSSGTSVPALVSADMPRWTAIDVNGGYSCGLREDASLWCWGWRYVGFIHTDTNVPEPTRVGVSADWQHLSTGRSHACAIKSDASLWCWGDAPAPAFEPTLIDTSYQMIASGAEHSCGVRANGTLWCFGDNASGQLGLGNSGGAVTMPTQVGTSASWIAVSAGDAHTCAIDATQTLYCWGANENMQLGLGMTTDPVFSPTPIASDGRFVLVDLGERHSCAVRAEGGLVCWGEGYIHGLGTLMSVGVPTDVPLADP